MKTSFFKKCSSRLLLLVCIGSALFSYSTANASVVYQTFSTGSTNAYISPSEWNNPSSLYYPLLQFDIPLDLAGDEILSADLKITGMDYGNSETASVEMVISGQSNIVVASDVSLPQGFGQYGYIDVTEAVRRWVGDGYSVYANEGLLLKRSAWYDLPTEYYPSSDYWPQLTIEYNDMSSVPIPGSLLLFLSSSLGILSLGRRSKAKNQKDKM